MIQSSRHHVVSVRDRTACRPRSLSSASGGSRPHAGSAVFLQLDPAWRHWSVEVDQRALGIADEYRSVPPRREGVHFHPSLTHPPMNNSHTEWISSRGPATRSVRSRDFQPHRQFSAIPSVAATSRTVRPEATKSRARRRKSGGLGLLTARLLQIAKQRQSLNTRVRRTGGRSTCRRTGSGSGRAGSSVCPANAQHRACSAISTQIHSQGYWLIRIQGVGVVGSRRLRAGCGRCS